MFPTAGHPLLDFNGMTMSGTEDNAGTYTEALNAVDGLCNTCAEANDTSGNFLMIALPVSAAAGLGGEGIALGGSLLICWAVSVVLPCRRWIWALICPPCRLANWPQELTVVTGVFVVSGNNLTNAFVFVGNSSSNNGMANTVCASKVDVPAQTPAVIACNTVGSYVTIAGQPSFLSLLSFPCFHSSPCWAWLPQPVVSASGLTWCTSLASCCSAWQPEPLRHLHHQQ